MVVLSGNLFGSYCTIVSLTSIVLNILFLIVTQIKRVEGFQEVLIFMQNISLGYIIVSICIMLVAPQTILIGTSYVYLPNGVLKNFESSLLNGITSVGFCAYLYTVLNFGIMFLYRYNVTCKTSSFSSVFSRRNIVAFLATSAVYSIISSTLFYYSTVDTRLLVERLNRTKDMGDFDLLPQTDPIFTQTRESSQIGPQTSTYRTPPLIEEHGRGQISSENLNLRTVNVFGYDYTRNPMIFFSAGIFTVSNILASMVILIASLVVACKLRGQQNTMSDKSQNEHKQLTNVLILDAYIPVLLAIFPLVNLLVCIFRHECLPIQEFLGVIILAPIPLIFPLLNIVLVSQLRVTAFQVLICMYWRKQESAKIKEQINAATENEDLNEDQLQALNKIVKKT